MGYNLGGGIFNQILSTVNAAEARRKQNEASAMDMMQRGFVRKSTGQAPGQAPGGGGSGAPGDPYMMPETVVTANKHKGFGGYMSDIFGSGNFQADDWEAGAHHPQVAENKRRADELAYRESVRDADVASSTAAAGVAAEETKYQRAFAERKRTDDLRVGPSESIDLALQRRDLQKTQAEIEEEALGEAGFFHNLIATDEQIRSGKGFLGSKAAKKYMDDNTMRPIIDATGQTATSDAEATAQIAGPTKSQVSAAKFDAKYASDLDALEASTDGVNQDISSTIGVERGNRQYMSARDIMDLRAKAAMKLQSNPEQADQINDILIANGIRPLQQRANESQAIASELGNAASGSMIPEGSSSFIGPQQMPPGYENEPSYIKAIMQKLGAGETVNFGGGGGGEAAAAYSFFGAPQDPQVAEAVAAVAEAAGPEAAQQVEKLVSSGVSVSDAIKRAVPWQGQWRGAPGEAPPAHVQSVMDDILNNKDFADFR